MIPSAARCNEADMMGEKDEARKGVCARERCFKKGERRSLEIEKEESGNWIC